MIHHKSFVRETILYIIHITPQTFSAPVINESIDIVVVDAADQSGAAGDSLVVGLGQLVGHGQDGQGAVLLGPAGLVDAPAVHQTSLPALDEHLAQNLLVEEAVHVEGLGSREVEGKLLVKFNFRQPAAAALHLPSNVRPYY